MGINSYADIIHQNTSWVIAGNWWMRDGVEKSVFITGKLNHRHPFPYPDGVYTPKPLCYHSHWSVHFNHTPNIIGVH